VGLSWVPILRVHVYVVWSMEHLTFTQKMHKRLRKKETSQIEYPVFKNIFIALYSELRAETMWQYGGLQILCTVNCHTKILKTGYSIWDGSFFLSLLWLFWLVPDALILSLIRRIKHSAWLYMLRFIATTTNTWTAKGVIGSWTWIRLYAGYK
jgi:hypothetical protein